MTLRAGGVTIADRAGRPRRAAEAAEPTVAKTATP